MNLGQGNNEFIQNFSGKTAFSEADRLSAIQKVLPLFIETER
jgi:hypothetical protein